MNPQKIHVIQSPFRKDFEGLVNDFCANNTVFATQTHVTKDEGAILYIAVLFYREVNTLLVLKNFGVKE